MTLRPVGIVMTAEGASAFNRVLADGDKAIAGFGKTAEGASAKVSGFSQIATGALRQVGAIAVSAGLQGIKAFGSFVQAGISGAADLQQSVANISTIKPSIDTSAVFASLNEMQTRVPQTAAQLGDSLYNIFSSVDVSQADALKLTEQFSKGAVGAGTSAETFGTAALGVMNAYKLSVDDASHISDVFFNTINAGVVTGQELASSLGPVTQSATAFGVSLDQLGGLIAGVTKEGGPAAQNINNLNNFLQKISTEKAQGQMAKLGVAVTDSTGAFRPVPAILGDLKARLGDMTEAERANALQTIFPDAQARQGAQTLISQLDFVNSAIETNQSTTGSATSAYEKMSATFQSQSLLAKNAIMGFAMTLGAAALPALTGFVSQIGPAVQWLQNFASVLLSSEHPMATLSAVIDGVLPGFSSFASFVGDNLTPILVGLGAALTAAVVPALVSAAGAAATAAVAFLPVIAPIVAIGAAAAALYVAWSTNFLGIQTTLTSVWGTIEPIFTSFGTVIGTITTLAGSVATAFGEGGIGAAFSTLTAGLPTVTAAFGDWASNAGTILLGLGEQFLNWVTPLIPVVLGKLADFGASIISWIVAQAPTWGAQLLTWGQVFVNWITPYIAPALAKLGEFASSAWNWIVQQAPTWVAKLESWGQSFLDWIGPKIPPLLSKLGELATSAWQWVQQQAPGWLTKLETWGQSLLDWVGPKIPPLLAKLGELASSAWSWVVEQAPVLLTKLEAWGKAFIDWIGPKIPPLLAKLGELASQFFTWVGQQAAPLVTKLEAWGKSFIDWIGPATVKFLGEWPGFLNKFLDWIGTAATPLLTKLGDWAVSFIKWVVPMIPDFIVALAGISVALLAFVAETAITLLTKLAEWGQAFGKWIKTDAIPALVGAWPGFWESLKGLMDEANRAATAKMNELGHAIVAGMKAGIAAAWSTFTGWIHDKVMEIPAAVRKALGIGSPSKVMAEQVGVPIVEGMQLGILKSMPNLLAAMRGSLDSTIQEIVGFVDSGDTQGPLTKAGVDAITAFAAGLKQGAPDLRTALDSVKSTVLDLGTLLHGNSMTSGTKQTWGSVVDLADKAWEQVRAGISAAVLQAQQTVTTATLAIQTSTTDAFTRLRASSDMAWSQIHLGIQDQITRTQAGVKLSTDEMQRGTAATFTLLQSESTRIWGQIHLGITDQITRTQQDATATWGKIGAEAASGWQKVKGNIETPMNTAKDTVATASAAMQQNLVIPPETQDAIFQTYRHVTDTMIAQLEAVTKQIDNVTEAWGRLAAQKPPQGPGGSGLPSGYGGLPGRAGGGPVMAGVPYMVGERGRELFVPSTSGSVLPASLTQRINPPASAQQIANNSVTNNAYHGPTLTYAPQYVTPARPPAQEFAIMAALVGGF